MHNKVEKQVSSRYLQFQCPTPGEWNEYVMNTHNDPAFDTHLDIVIQPNDNLRPLKTASILIVVDHGS